jgi:hypothetical protein
LPSRRAGTRASFRACTRCEIMYLAGWKSLLLQFSFQGHRLGARSGGNTWAELAPTWCREGSCGSKRVGRTWSGMLAKTAGRNITRTVQLREMRPDRHHQESPVAGQTRLWRDIRRPSTLMGKADADREAKETRTCREPGVRPMACGERDIDVAPETPAFPQGHIPHRHIR